MAEKTPVNRLFAYFVVFIAYLLKCVFTKNSLTFPGLKRRIYYLYGIMSCDVQFAPVTGGLKYGW